MDIFINTVMIYHNKVPVKNKHGYKRYHYTKKNGKWKPKHQFESEQDASRYIKRYKMIDYTAYQCPYCMKWHIGRNNPN